MSHHIIDSSDEVIYPAASIEKSRKNKFLIGAASLVVAISALVVINLSNTQTQGVGNYRNWSADAIIQGGAISEKELLDKYNQNASGVQSIFNHYGITASDLSGKTSTIRHGTVFQDGTVYDGNKKVAINAYSVSRLPFNDAYGNTPRTINVKNGPTLYEGPNMSIFVRPVDAFILYRDGQFWRAIISSCANPVVATPTEPKTPVKPTPPPVEKPVKPTPPVEKPTPPVEKPTPPKVAALKCVSLSRREINRTNHHFTAAATHENTKITGYTFDFGDGKPQTITSNVIEKTFKPGKHTAKVTVTAKSDSATQTDTNKNCEVTFTVAEAPKTPVATCDQLSAKAIQGKDHTYRFSLIYTAESGAKLTKVVYNFGDKTAAKTLTKNMTQIDHTYAAPGTYTATATLTFDITVEGKTSQSKKECTFQVTIAKPEMCPLPGKEDLPKNSPECVEPLIETPPELPQTGLAEWFAGATGLAAIAAAGYYWNASRKNLEDKLLKK